MILFYPEFSTYNANVNLFSFITIASEFPATGKKSVKCTIFLTICLIIFILYGLFVIFHFIFYKGSQTIIKGSNCDSIGSTFISILCFCKVVDQSA